MYSTRLSAKFSTTPACFECLTLDVGLCCSVRQHLREFKCGDARESEGESETRASVFIAAVIAAAFTATMLRGFKDKAKRLRWSPSETLPRRADSPPPQFPSSSITLRWRVTFRASRRSG